ncbi:hypothetical protein AJ79_02683 [Helicocarpus griseus UAMH5409]|uniref:Uncharacterized protein n=1 Tax=Helicocarpus griseus UAMH5409 TaxID=1447875 RepID=A0A2B7Y1T0_9EURO|nr:hypothetical protein AJ79_02683 [Helicocarpus griseus UAMH5409]
MASNSHASSAEGYGKVDASFSQNVPTDEIGLSPATKKILEKCAVPVTPVILNKEFRSGPSLITRPSDCGIETGGFDFHFAKPKLPTPNFTSRSKSKPVAGASTRTDTSGLDASTPTSIDRQGPQMTHLPSRTTPTQTKDDDHGGSKAPLRISQDVSAPETSIRVEANIPRISQEDNGVPETENREVDAQPEAAPEQGCDLSDHSNYVKAQGDLNKTAESDPRTSPSRGRSRSSGVSISISPHPHPKVARPQPKQTPKSKISKRPKLPTPGSNGTAAKIPQRKENPFATQPSEEDLFYMLIHKLKKRDEMEAETNAMKERMESEMLELTQANDNLRCKLEEAEIVRRKQQEQINSRNAVVERWKAKFNKFRTFVTSVGNDFEVLRKEGHALKSAQNCLAEEKQHIREALKQMNKNTDQLGTRWSQHRATIMAVKDEVSSMEKSVLVATTKAADTDKLVAMERNRATTLENYIKNYSSKHQKQAAEIQQTQSQAMLKIDEIQKRLEGGWDSLLVSIKKEVETGFASCLSLLESLSQKKTVEPQDLDKMDNAIRELFTQLQSSIDVSTKKMEVALDLQTDHGNRVSVHLTELEAAVNSAASVVSQLAEARQLNGSLQEKLKTTETSLADVAADRDKLKSQEAALQRHIGDLEIEISTLQKDETEITQFKEAEMSSELQIQLEATSAALTQVTDGIRTKEIEMQEIQLKLAETTQKLMDAERRVEELENEKLSIQDKAQRTEQRVREELTRANLAAKDQNRAWFEQERHKLKREKLLADTGAQKTAEQLAATKRLLQEVEKSKDELVARVNKQQVEIDNLQFAAEKKDSEAATEMVKIKELRETVVQELQAARDQLEIVTKEKEELKSELRELRISLEHQQEQESLQEALDVLQYEIAEKDMSILSLKEELSKFEENTKKVTSLQQEVLDKSADIAALRESMDEMTTANTELEDALKQKIDELVTTEQKLEESEKTAVEISQIKRDAEQRDNELSQLRSQIEDANRHFENAENVLKQSGVLVGGESLRDCLDTLESRLKSVVGGAGSAQGPGHAESDLIIPLRTSSKRQGAGRKRTMSSTHAEWTGPSSGSREYRITEIGYRTQSIRENLCPLKTPSSRRRDVKLMPTTSVPRIRPFSEFQYDTTLKHQTSPMSELTDLNAFFPSTPLDTKDHGLAPIHTAEVKKLSQDAEVFPLSRQIAPSNGAPGISISNAVDDVMAASRHKKQPHEPHENIGRSSDRGTAAAPRGNGTANSSRDGNKLRTPPKKTSSLKRKDMSEDELQVIGRATGYQKPPEKLPRKGILKDTTKQASTMEMNSIQTPRHEDRSEKPTGIGSTVTFRRPARKSKYFNATTSPTASITSRGGRCGSVASKSTTPAAGTRERPRRGRRGSPKNLQHKTGSDGIEYW